MFSIIKIKGLIDDLKQISKDLHLSKLVPTDEPYSHDKNFVAGKRKLASSSEIDVEGKKFERKKSY